MRVIVNALVAVCAASFRLQPARRQKGARGSRSSGSIL